MKLTQLIALSLIGVGAVSLPAQGQERTDPPPTRPEPPRLAAPDAPDHPDREEWQRLMAERDKEEAARLRAQAERLQREVDEMRRRIERSIAEAAEEGARRVPGAPPQHPIIRQLEPVRFWLDTVDRYTRLARNSTDAGIAAVIAANDLLRARGPEPAIDYFNQVLPKVQNEAILRAIRYQLFELYRSAGQQERALEQLQILMTSPPPSPPLPAIAPHPPMPGMVPGTIR